MKTSTLLPLFALVVLPVVGCYEPEIVGLVDPDEECGFSVDNDIRHTGTLDVGPTETLTHSYVAVLLLDGASGAEVSSASVAFSDADGVPLEGTEYGGRDIVFPTVEGERHSDIEGTINDEGPGTALFTLITEEEAAPLQNYATADEDFEMQIEIRAVIGGVDTTYPYFMTMRVCQQCLVGVGAELDGDALVCPDGSDPTPVADAPCREGQDEVFSTCPSS